MLLKKKEKKTEEYTAAGEKKRTFWTGISWNRPGSVFRRIRPDHLLVSLGLVCLLAFVFYRSWLAVPFLLPLCVPIQRGLGEAARMKRKDRLSEAFGEALASVMTGMRAGYSPENAFREAASDMEFRFGQGAEMTRELRAISAGLDNHIPLAQLLDEFAARSGIEEIRDFAQVFSIASKNGGNMVQVMEDTARLLQGRMEIEGEIRLLLSSRQLEMRIMEAVPFFIILYISLTSRGFFDPLYHNPAGTLFMTICLALYLAACLVGERISNIRL